MPLVHLKRALSKVLKQDNLYDMINFKINISYMSGVTSCMMMKI